MNSELNRADASRYISSGRVGPGHPLGEIPAAIQWERQTALSRQD